MLEIIRLHRRKIDTKCVVPTFEKDDHCSSFRRNVYRAVNNNDTTNYIKACVKQIFIAIIFVVRVNCKRRYMKITTRCFKVYT